MFKDTTLCGYNIPRKNTVIFLNLFAIHNDTQIFSNPEEFNPRRFINDSGCLQNADLVLSFGVGECYCLAKVLWTGQTKRCTLSVRSCSVRHPMVILLKTIATIVTEHTQLSETVDFESRAKLKAMYHGNTKCKTICNSLFLEVLVAIAFKALNEDFWQLAYLLPLAYNLWQ